MLTPTKTIRFRFSETFQKKRDPLFKRPDCRPSQNYYIKYKKHYHIALPVSKGQREGPTMILFQISSVVKDLQTIVKKLKLEIISIAKTNFVNVS